MYMFIFNKSKTRKNGGFFFFFKERENAILAVLEISYLFSAGPKRTEGSEFRYFIPQ